MLFADDSLLFFKASKEEAQAVKNVLHDFQINTGQLLSESKCSLLLSEACPSEVAADIKETLGVTTSSFENKYLGVPTPEGRMKDENFQPIMERVGKRCNDWSEKYMSFAAKEVHIKSVIHTLPCYTMGVFLLSKGFCEKYERTIREFRWGDE